MLAFKNGVTFLPRLFLFEYSFTLVTSLMNGMSHNVFSHSSSNFKAQVCGYLVSFRTSSNAKSQSSLHLKCPYLYYLPINSISLYSDPQQKQFFRSGVLVHTYSPCTREEEGGGLGIQIHSEFEARLSSVRSCLKNNKKLPGFSYPNVAVFICQL